VIKPSIELQELRRRIDRKAKSELAERGGVVGAGDGFTVRLVRHRQTKEAATDRLHLSDTAPVLDPTDSAGKKSREPLTFPARFCKDSL